jgi:hypothetical protein
MMSSEIVPGNKNFSGYNFAGNELSVPKRNVKN